MDKHLLGAYGEILASRYLRFHGYELVTAHYNCRLGEIDLIVEDKKHICFVEVKTRKSEEFGRPCQAVNDAKKARIIMKIMMVPIFFLALNVFQEVNLKIFMCNK